MLMKWSILLAPQTVVEDVVLVSSGMGKILCPSSENDGV